MLSKRLLVGFLILLSLILIQTVFKPFRSAPLAGAEYIPDPIPLDLNHWISQDWQNNQEKRLKKTLGFRPSFVRIYNQLLFTCFDEYNSQIKAFGDTLYEKAYLDAIEGKDYLGLQQVNAKVDSLVAFRNKLETSGKQLMILIAPNKWRTFRKAKPSESNNYKAFKQALRKQNIHVIDALDYFIHSNDTSSYPLHSKEGTHWSIYGAFKSSQILHDSAEKWAITLPETSIDSWIISDPKNTDKDLHDLLNILMPPIHQNLAYPKLNFGTTKKLKALVVGDSYYWTFYYLGLHQNWFDAESPFFYYNQRYVLHDINDKQPINQAFRDKSIARAELVILVISEPSLKWFGYGIFGQYLN